MDTSSGLLPLLAPVHARAIELADQGLEPADLARRLGIDPSAVGPLVRIARAKLAALAASDETLEYDDGKSDRVDGGHGLARDEEAAEATLSTAGLDRLERLLWTRLLAAGLFYLLLAVTVLAVIVQDPAHASRGRLIASIVLAAATAVALVAPLGVLMSRRAFRRAVWWAVNGRRPDERECAEVKHLPFRQSSLVLACGAAATPPILGVCRLYYPWSQVGRMLLGAGVTVGGAWLLAFVVAEETLGPLLGQAMGSSNSDARFGIVARVCAAWVQGAAVPIACLVIAPGRVGLNAVQWLVFGVGLSFSLTASVMTAQSISRPLRELRKAVRRVREGDMTVVVATDDGGEIGQLQVAVNEMLTGLRQRERLHQLLGSHVGEAVARRALEGDDALGGEIRDVSIVFVDVIGSTALADLVPPDELVGVLNAFYDALVGVVDEHLGFVNKFEGDAALCIFGAPTDQPDHAERSLRAARSLRTLLDRLVPDLAGLDAGIGVSTGAVFAGNVGTRSRYEYTVIGAAVNEAARLSEISKCHPSRLLASAATVRRAGDEAAGWRAHETVRLRGKAHDTLLFTVSGVSPDRAPASMWS